MKKIIATFCLLNISSLYALPNNVHPLFRPKKKATPKEIPIEKPHKKMKKFKRKKTLEKFEKRYQHQAINPDKYYKKQVALKRKNKTFPKPTTRDFEEILLTMKKLQKWLQNPKKIKKLKKHIRAKLEEASGERYKVSNEIIIQAVRNIPGSPNIKLVTDYIIKNQGLTPLTGKKELINKEKYKKMVQSLRKKLYSKSKRGITRKDWEEVKRIYKFIPEFDPEFRKILKLKMKLRDVIKYAKTIDNIKQKLYKRKLREKWIRNMASAKREFIKARNAARRMPSYRMHMTKLLEHPLKKVLKNIPQIDNSRDKYYENIKSTLRQAQDDRGKGRKKIIKKVLEKPIFAVPEYDPYFMKTIKEDKPELFDKAKKNYKLKRKQKNS